MTATRRAGLVGAFAAVTTVVTALSAAAQTPAESVTLFKVVSPRDEVIVGVTRAEFPALAGGGDALARKIAADGQMSVWRYTVGRGEGGALAMVPSGRVSLFAAGIVRIEPYAATHPVVAPR